LRRKLVEVGRGLFQRGPATVTDLTNAFKASKVLKALAALAVLLLAFFIIWKVPEWQVAGYLTNKEETEKS
jgi:hypothetical protein